MPIAHTICHYSLHYNTLYFPSTSSFVEKSDLDNTNNTINAMFAKLVDKFDNQDENIKALSW